MSTGRVLRKARRRSGLLRGERGSVLIIVAVGLVSILGFSALAVDAGYLYYRRARLQDVADSAALSAATEIIKTQGNSAKKKKECGFEAAIRYVELNGMQVASKDTATYTAQVSQGPGAAENGCLTVTYPDDLNQVQIEITLNASVFLARIFARESAAIQVIAAARVGQASSQTGNLLPVAFFWGDYQWYTRYQMTLTPGAGQSGNFGFLDYKPSEMFEGYLRFGYGGTLEVGQTVETYPGVSAGQIDPAISGRVTECFHGCSVVDAGGVVCVDVKEDCPRVVIIPIVSDFFEQSGKGYVVISAFAKFFIESYNKGSKVLTGWFLQEVSASDVVGGITEFATQAVKLIR